MKARWFSGILLLLLAVSAAAAEHRWVLTLPWVPQAQFAGIYYAAGKGIFAKYGLQVEIRHRAAEFPIFEALKSPECDLVVAPLLTALKARNDGVAIVNLAQISQNSSVVLVARNDFGFERAGRKVRVGVWNLNFDLLPRIFLKQQRFDAEAIAVNDGVGLFLWEAIDVVAAMEFNEYYQLLAAGFQPEELIRYRMRDYGLNVPEDGLYGLAETFRRYPAECRALRKALIEGWRGAMRHPGAALELVRAACERENRPFDPAQQEWMLHAFGRELKLDQPAQCGRLTAHNYDFAVKLLRKHGEIDTADSYAAFCPMEQEAAQ